MKTFNVRIACLLTVLLSGASLNAQERPPDIGTTLREIEQQRPAAPAPSRAALRVDATARPALEAGPGVTFALSSVRISGNTAFEDVELLPMVDGLAGRRVSLADLRAAAARITAYYREHGYPVARAYVPAQRIDAGGVEIAVLEGRYGALQVRNDSRLADSVLRNSLRAVSPDAVIQTTPLDRELLLLNDLAGVSVAATLTPGAQVGTSDLAVDVQRTPTLSGTLEADNFGNQYTGEWRAGGSVAAANLAGRGDLLSVRGLISQDTGLWYGRAAYEIPVTRGGLRLGGALSHTYYTLGEQFDSLDADGSADIYTLFTQYPLIRSPRGRLDAQLAFNRFDLDDQIDAIDAHNPRELQSGTISVSGNMQDDLLGGAVNAASLALGRGDLQVNDAAAAQIDSATAQTEGGFTTLLYSALRLQRISDAVQLYVAMQGQAASQNLDSSQKFVLGGPQGVRAYDQGTGVGDEGILGSVELRYTLPSYAWFGRPQLVAFFDAGRVRVNVDPYLAADNHIDLYGAGVGFNTDVARRIKLRAGVAWRVGDEPDQVDSSSSSQAWVQVATSF